MLENAISTRSTPTKFMYLRQSYMSWHHHGLSQCGAWMSLDQSPQKFLMDIDSFLWLSIISQNGWKQHHIPMSLDRWFAASSRKIKCRYGIPKKIISDNATNLNNKMMKQICEQFKIKHHNSAPYHPKMNGAVEAANKNVKKIVAKMMDTHKD